MKYRFSLCLIGLLLSLCSAKAKAKEGQAHLSATVLRVQKHDVDSFVGGSNPTDAPLRSDVFHYDVWLKVDCSIYVARYDSAYDQPPSAFTAQRQIDLRVEKHVLYASMPGGSDAKMSIVKRSTDSTGSCSPR